MVRGLLVVLLLWGFGTETAWASDEAPSSEVVIAAFQAALDNHDHGRAADLLTEDARALVPNAVRGRNAIAQFLIGRYAADTSIEVSDYAANGAHVTWMTRLSSKSHIELNWDEAVVMDGRIALWIERVPSEALAVMPTFRCARDAGPSVSALGPTAVRPPDPQGPRVSDVLLSLAAASGVAAGLLYGIWRERYHPPRGRVPGQGGLLLRGLRRWHESDTAVSTRRARAYNSDRGHGPQASTNPRRYSSS
jgi:hypothetical protein